jgi:hypothetical protein
MKKNFSLNVLAQEQEDLFMGMVKEKMDKNDRE